MDADICPHLGSLGDRENPSTYPHRRNRCYLSGKGQAISPATQGRFCLGGRHALCPRYTSSIEAESSSSSPRRFPALALMSGLLLLLCLGGAMAYRNLHGHPQAAVASQPISPSTTLILTATLTLNPTATPTSLPSPTATATPVPPTYTPPLPTPTPRPKRPVSSSPPTRIVIPKIGLDSKVVEVGWKVVEEDGQLMTEWEVADYAVGHHKGSAYPGRAGNCVISGHHNIKGEVFRYLVNLEPGDKVILYAGEVAYHYTVKDKFIVPEKDASKEQQLKNKKWIDPTPDERLTLVTCWPYWSNTHRLIIIAKPTVP